MLAPEMSHVRGEVVVGDILFGCVRGWVRGCVIVWYDDSFERRVSFGMLMLA